MHVRPSEMEALEQVERAVLKNKSKQSRFGKRPDAGVFFNSVYNWVEAAHLAEPCYSADTRERDKWLSSFWRQEPHLAGVISSVNAIDSNRGWHLTGGRNQVNRFIPVFRDAEDGEGWRQYISLQSTSYYTTDLGALTETARNGTGGPLAAMYHLDPTRCHMTGKRNAPLFYERSKEPWTQDEFFRLVSMRNIREEYNGIGICAVSRVLDMSKIMLAVYNHELEQLGARAPKGLLLLQNIGQSQWKEAMRTRDAQLDSDMRKYYNAVAVIAQEGVDAIDAKLIALSQLPEGFNLEVFTNLLMYTYALCIGYDPNEFWPVAAGSMGRGRETDIQHRKGTGKGGLNFMLAYQDQIKNQLPDSLSFQFEQRDQEGEKLDAELMQAVANVAATLYGGGKSTSPGPAGSSGGAGEAPEVPDSQPKPAAGTAKIAPQQGMITIEEARQFLVKHGVIPAEWTEQQEEVDATDTKEAAQRLRRDELLADENVQRAVFQYPNEPIVRYSFDPVTSTGKMKVLFESGSSALARTRFQILKPVALIPDMSRRDVEEVVEEEDSEEGQWRTTSEEENNP